MAMRSFGRQFFWLVFFPTSARVLACLARVPALWLGLMLMLSNSAVLAADAPPLSLSEQQQLVRLCAQSNKNGLGKVGPANSAVLATACSLIQTPDHTAQPGTDQAHAEASTIDENNRFQDLKNFLALSQLKQAQAEAELLYLPPPFNSTSMAAGFKDQQARHVLGPLKNIYGAYLSDWNVLLKPKQLQKNEFLYKHLQKYCSLNEGELGLCEAQPGLKQPEDMSATSLLGRNVLASTQEQEAANLYIRNLTNPQPIALLPDKLLFKNKAKHVLTDQGKDNLMAKYRQQTMVSLAQESLLNLLAERMPYQNLDGKAKSKEQQDSSRVNILEQEANRRFNNSDWYSEMNNLSTPALLREIANMMALQLTMAYRDSKRLERLEALQAAQVAYLAQQIGQVERGQQQILTNLSSPETDP